MSYLNTVAGITEPIAKSFVLRTIAAIEVGTAFIRVDYFDGDGKATDFAVYGKRKTSGTVFRALSGLTSAMAVDVKNRINYPDDFNDDCSQDRYYDERAEAAVDRNEMDFFARTGGK